MLFFNACKDPNDAGLGVLPDNDLINAEYVDTFTITMRSQMIDSVRTGNLTQDMLGDYLDPEFGRISAGTAAQFRLTGANVVFGNNPANLTLDSIMLRLDLEGFYGRYNDPLELEIFELTEPIPADSQLYSNSYVAFDSSYDYANGAIIDFSDLPGFLDFVK